VVTGAFLLTVLAVWGLEARVTAIREPDTMPFMQGMREIWAERRTRNFTLFVFLSMNAYFMQELILEPYAGLVWGFTPGQSTTLSGAQNGGVFIGMLTVGIAATGFKLGSLRSWAIAGCLGSAVSLLAIAVAAFTLTPLVIALGFFNGMFAVAAIGSMMALAAEGRGQREGTRMGLWGAAQAIAAGFGGLTGAAAVDILRGMFPDATAFGLVFTLEAALFIAAALMARYIMENTRSIATAMVPGE
jgi:BCD family chlorophyll transporter-like MFS transporter